MKEKFLIFIVITLLGMLRCNLFCQYREAETFLEGFEGTGVYGAKKPHKLNNNGVSHCQFNFIFPRQTAKCGLF